jgi:DNA gyrase subunit A
VTEYTAVSLTQEVQTDYLNYSLAVLIGRAIPNLYDGLKPAARRVLTAMRWLNLKPEGRYMKSARVEGETMGKLHPHGGAYGVMVTLAQPHNNQIPLIDGWGNWGSSTDSAAAARYTEAKLSKFAWDVMLADEKTWETVPNYDGSLQEPQTLNAAFPYVLLNGTEGIGVGFATKLASHELGEIAEALVYVSKGNLLAAANILKPSFPTGCDIVEDTELARYVETGAGNIRCRARMAQGTITVGKRKQQRPTLTFTNLPPGTNPEKIGEQIAAGLDKGVIANVTEITDESDVEGDRILVVLKSDADATIVAKQLYAYTDLDSKYSAKTLVIDGIKPVELSPVGILQRWLPWRHERLKVRFTSESQEANARLHIVEGLCRAVSQIDELITVIKASKDRTEALAKLIGSKYKYSRQQAEAILQLRLQSLTNLDAANLEEEAIGLRSQLASLETLLSDDKERGRFILREIAAISKAHKSERKSAFIAVPDSIAGRDGSPRKVSPTVSKPRYWQINKKIGSVTPTKTIKGSLVVSKEDKIILATEDGTFKKVGYTFKGPISDSASPVILAQRDTEVAAKKFAVVYTLGEEIRAFVVSGEDLLKVTSKGKKLLPVGASLLHFGEKPYTVEWHSKRKRPVVIGLDFKLGRPGSKGLKVGAIAEAKV